MARLPRDVSNTSSKLKHAMSIKHLLDNIPKTVFRGCVRSADHYRRAWLARAQVAANGGPELCLEDVEEVMARHRHEMNNVTRRRS